MLNYYCIGIMHVDSITGHMMHPLKTLHFYSAAKHAVTAIVEGIRQELRKMKSKCHVTISLHYNYILYITCKIIFNIIFTVYITWSGDDRVCREIYKSRQY